MRSGILLIFGLLVAACTSDSPSAPMGPLDVRIVVGVGEAADVQGASIRIRFQGVMGDSRCPADVVCIQGGDAVVRIDVLPSGSPGPSVTYDLHTGNMQPVNHANLLIALVQLSPYPFSSRPVSPGEYRATLRITRSNFP
jgi:hypothetical protein